jgi:hypothetical protein
VLARRADTEIRCLWQAVGAGIILVITGLLPSADGPRVFALAGAGAITAAAAAPLRRLPVHLILNQLGGD